MKQMCMNEVIRKGSEEGPTEEVNRTTSGDLIFIILTLGSKFQKREWIN